MKWLSDPKLAIWAVTIFYIWSGLAFKIVLFLAGLQKIDEQYYLSSGPDRWSQQAADVLSRHAAAVVADALDGHHGIGDLRLQAV